MPWTLGDALQECARNTYNVKTMVQTGGVYTNKGLEYATRFLSGINYAARKIARERLGPLFSEEITLDEYGRFDLSDLTHDCIRIRAITLDGVRYDYNVSQIESVEVNGLSNAIILIAYEYLPAELTLSNLTAALPIDERYVDPRVLCQYANYQFLSEEGTEYDSARAQVWLGLYNDSFENIRAGNRLPRRVRYNG
ncbi:MAG: hypothetical protein GT601_17590 [Acidaminobacter sp.]|uniref:hypothetical protein n=1 Tax=Acidaminobacter sp. TaxID=1872102 RepID=UPI00137CF446|nr:hypothetical protein [Acidaminobacter sp.]MZQ99483.1 hypothetical protein [Acidaminobacter sp.]